MEILEAYKLKDLQQRDRPINLHTKYNQTNNYNRYHRHNNFLVNFQDKRVLIVSQQKFFNNNSFSDGQVFQSKLILPNQKNQIDVIQAANCQQEHPEISLNQQQSVENEQWPDFGCEGIKVQRAHQPTSQCQGKIILNFCTVVSM
eukprot:TRINITY_DN26261_c0_g1_i5.p2 TRINITY_DN26261_c0_g1~~TRINITY_DN26261_c0_g1_i5.p2  ORF type:complete len:145 (-),score=8.48 TRINITY_DN26261_c0_g1_i5:31-465(-)